MTRALLLSVVVLLLGPGLACAGPPAQKAPADKAPAVPADKGDRGAASPARPVRIEETTIAEVNGWKVTVGNIMKDRWRGPDGQERHGITAEIGLYDAAKREQGRHTLGEGGVLTIAGQRYLVARVQAGQGGGNGFVELRPAR